jgi:hypothetical protein
MCAYEMEREKKKERKRGREREKKKGRGKEREREREREEDRKRERESRHIMADWADTPILKEKWACAQCCYRKQALKRESEWVYVCVRVRES